MDEGWSGMCKSYCIWHLGMWGIRDKLRMPCLHVLDNENGFRLLVLTNSRMIVFNKHIAYGMVMIIL